MPRAVISHQGTHFCNRPFENLMTNYVIPHQVSTTYLNQSLYHPQSNKQVKLSNREIKSILEKIVNPKRKDWLLHLTDALWAYCTTYETVLGSSPYRLVYGKVFRLPVEIEH